MSQVCHTLRKTVLATFLVASDTFVWQRVSYETMPPVSQSHHTALPLPSMSITIVAYNCKTLHEKAHLISSHSESFVAKKTDGTQDKHAQTWKLFTNLQYRYSMLCDDMYGGQ